MSAQSLMDIQVLGDSFAVRFKRFLDSKPPGSENLNCIFSKGISGATVPVLKAFVKTHRTALRGNVPLILFLGTNDFFTRVQPSVFRDSLKSFLRFLRRTYAGCRLVLFTLPTYPRVGNSVPELQRRQRINNFLVTLQSDIVRVIRLPENFSCPDYFHAFYGKSWRRDGMHFNDRAYCELLPLLLKALDR